MKTKKKQQPVINSEPKEERKPLVQVFYSTNKALIYLNTIGAA
jgi:hypothetical protein